jgi:hypothetical protein
LYQRVIAEPANWGVGFLASAGDLNTKLEQAHYGRELSCRRFKRGGLEEKRQEKRLFSSRGSREVHYVGSFLDNEGNKLWFCSYV